jgi:hypothetical protein
LRRSSGFSPTLLPARIVGLKPDLQRNAHCHSGKLLPPLA